MELPVELKKLIERNKVQYGLEGEEEEILKRIIPNLEDEDIIRLYDELCEEENNKHISNKRNRPNFEKYREEILEYLDDSIVKAEIIKREQNQSSKPDLQQRNYTYISEFTTTLDNKPDKRKIINSFYRKIRQLQEQINLLNVRETINNIELTIHIYQCILHIVEKMEIDLVLYRGPKYKERYKISAQLIDLREIKRKIKRKSRQENQIRLQNIFLNENIKKINKLKIQKEKLEQTILDDDGER